MVWAIFSVVTFAGHMAAGLYTDVIYLIAEYIWFISVAFSILTIYSGANTAGVTHEDRRSVAIASVAIGVIILLGLCISATSWLFKP
ncbi:hypothetical protein ACFLTP_00875 [Chloroflexota bacterium]